MGHGGDPRLAHLQYLIDQGEMDYMPQLLKISRASFKSGPFSIWTVAGGDMDPANGIKLYRSSQALGGDKSGALAGKPSGRHTAFANK
jgi:hypothetical protein